MNDLKQEQSNNPQNDQNQDISKSTGIDKGGMFKNMAKSIGISMIFSFIFRLIRRFLRF